VALSKDGVVPVGIGIFLDFKIGFLLAIKLKKKNYGFYCIVRIFIIKILIFTLKTR
jgi:hypothetical protein